MSYQQRLCCLNALSVKDSRFVANMVFTCKLVHGMTSSPLDNVGLSLCGRYSRGPRPKHEILHLIRDSQFFLYRVPAIRNILPKHVRTVPSIYLLKKPLLHGCWSIRNLSVRPTMLLFSNSCNFI